MHIVVLGGGGAMGRITVRALVEDERVTRVTVADWRLAAAERAVAWLDRGREKAHPIACDVRDAESLAVLLADAGAVLNATDYTFNLEVMRAALAAHVSYADLGGLFHMTRRQYELDAAFHEAGLTAVLGIGSTPGITNILARVAVDALERIERLDVRIGCADLSPAQHTFVAPYSIRTILDECTLNPMVYRNGRWSAVPPMSGDETIDFPAPVGRVTAMHTLHSEVALFPVSFRARGLRHASFKIAFPPDFLAQMRLLVDVGLATTDPLAVRVPQREGQEGAVNVSPREVLVAALAARDATRTPKAPDAPDDCDILRVEASGTRNGQAVTLIEEMIVRPYTPWRVGGGDVDTGVPLAIAGILLASGCVERTGAHGAEVVFQPNTFLRELARYNMHAHEMSGRAVS